MPNKALIGALKRNDYELAKQIFESDDFYFGNFYKVCQTQKFNPCQHWEQQLTNLNMTHHQLYELWQLQNASGSRSFLHVVGRYFDDKTNQELLDLLTTLMTSAEVGAQKVYQLLHQPLMIQLQP